MTQKLRSFLLFFALPAATAVGACDCAGNDPIPPAVVDCSTMGDGTACTEVTNGVCCGGTCQGGAGTCQPGFECTGTPMCTSGSVTCSTCTPLPALTRGRIADDLDSTVQTDGTFVMSGYSPGDPANYREYGDLVIGTYDPANATVDWEIVDGAPTTGTIAGDVTGWRGGIRDAGDDVGRHSSIEANQNDLLVAYADDTNGSLKAAVRVGNAWSVHVIDANAGTLIRWTSMALDDQGLPIVSYLVLTDQNLDLGQTKPQMALRIARPTTTLPNAGTWTWNHYDLLPAADMGCAYSLCATGQVCLTNNLCVVSAGTADCATTCASNAVCYAGTCYQRKKASDYLLAVGQYTDIEPIPGGGFGLVYYDRPGGRIFTQTCPAANAPCDDAADWAAPVQLDGFGSTHLSSSDCGIGASLFIDSAGTWHVTYVNGTEEELWYARLPNGTTPTFELVDDGTAAMTGLTIRPPAQKSYVGDDSAVVAADVAGGVEIRVSYADVTLHTTVLATRAPAGGWSWVELPPPADTEASFSVTQAWAGADVTYVGSEWLKMADPTVPTDVYQSDTAVYPNPAPAVGADGGL